MNALAYITINIDPVLYHLGPLSLRWYGLMYALGLLVGYRVTGPVARRQGVAESTLQSIFWIVTIAGLLGGRIYYVVQNNPASFLAHPAHIFAFWEGGMAFYGAIFLGLPALFLATRFYHVPFLLLLDVAALFAPLAQSIGRIGNIVNGDILGYPSTLPWATAYANSNSFARTVCASGSSCTAYQPAGVYELIFSAALFIALWRARAYFTHRGTLFCAYLATYSVGQIILFAWRDNAYVLGSLKQAQVTALVVLIALIPMTIVLTRFRQPFGVANRSYALPLSRDADTSWQA